MKSSYVIDPPEHLADKYRVYAIRLQSLEVLLVHVGRPISFKTFVETFIMRHIELIDIKAKKMYMVSDIIGVEKVPNSNTPVYEITAEGQLIEIL